MSKLSGLRKAATKKNIKKFIRRRPSWFWWTLANLSAAAFAVASWSVCLYLFNFPEHPFNYDFLRKLQRIKPVVAYAPLEAPEGSSADPTGLLTRFYNLETDQLLAHNLRFKRNYITNFHKPEVVTYVEGTFRVRSSRNLTEEDFFYPGQVVTVEAVVQADELAQPSPYPVLLELLLPTREDPPGPLFEIDHLFDFKKIEHRILVLHATQWGNRTDPTICLTVVPLSFENLLTTAGSPLSLAPPEPLNVSAPFPVVAEHREQ